MNKMMNWLVLISEGRENHSYRFSTDNRTDAENQAVKCFDQFTYDTGREYYDEESLPTVILFEIDKSIPVAIHDYWKEKQVETEKRRREQQEKYDLAVFERLKKKFDK